MEDKNPAWLYDLDVLRTYKHEIFKFCERQAQREHDIHMVELIRKVVEEYEQRNSNNELT